MSKSFLSRLADVKEVPRRIDSHSISPASARSEFSPKSSVCAIQLPSRSAEHSSRTPSRLRPPSARSVFASSRATTVGLSARNRGLLHSGGSCRPARSSTIASRDHMRAQRPCTTCMVTGAPSAAGRRTSASERTRSAAPVSKFSESACRPEGQPSRFIARSTASPIESPSGAFSL